MWLSLVMVVAGWAGGGVGGVVGGVVGGGVGGLAVELVPGWRWCWMLWLSCGLCWCLPAWLAFIIII